MAVRTDPDTKSAPVEAPARGVLAEALVLGVIVVVFAISAWDLIAVPAPLFHDEAVYAVQGRAMVDETAPRTGVRGHRAPALAFAGAAVQLVTDGERALRSVGLLAGVAALGAVWWVGRLAGGPVAGVLAAAAVATVPAVVESAAFFLTDLPAAAALLWCAGVLLFALAGREEAHPALLAAAPLAAAAFYLRYGSVVPIALLILVAGALWFRVLRRSLPTVVWTLGLGGALLVPHLVNAVRDYGTPWGRVQYTSEAVGRFGEALDAPPAFVQYAEWFPGWLPGWPVAALVLAGVVLMVVALLREGLSAHARVLVFLVVPGALTMVVLAVGVHADERFTLFPFALAASAGAGALGRLQVAGRAGVAALVVAVAMLPLLVTVADAHDQLRENREHSARNNKPIRDGARWIAARTEGPCVTISSYEPQLTWYSGCTSYAWPNVLRSQIAQRARGPVFLFLIENGKYEPEDGPRARWLERASEPVHELPNQGARLGPGEIRRWEPDALRAR
jgi:4-amino-4-deoxy-L-arabinose transferase-like glycosyltransferase